MTPANKNKRFPSEALAACEVAALLKACGKSPTGVRNRAAITLMYRAGLRCAEALSVRRCDVVFDQDGRATVRVLRPKGAGRGKPPRVVGLGARSALALRAQLESRNMGEDSPLCSTRNGTQPSTNYFRALLPRLARRAGIERRVNPHALRHTWAYDAMMRGEPVPVISKALGHSSLSITAVYLDHLAPLDVITAMQELDE